MRLAQVELETGAGVVIAAIEGEIDMSNAARLREDLTAMTPNAAYGLVLDLSAVEYLDSAGIHLVHRIRDELRTRGQRLALVIPESSLIHDTLRLAGLRWEDDVFTTQQPAREALLPPPADAPAG